MASLRLFFLCYLKNLLHFLLWLVIHVVLHVVIHVLLYNNYMEQYRLKKENAKTSGGDFYATAKKRISLRFAGYVNNAVKDNTLLFRDAYKLTTLKGNTYNRFINEYLYQA